ncbi:hypothetical protein AB0G20_37435 [Streptomyces sp. NPDC024017]|uniref:hypothetical protein n=1 Tax=Streptomyces sp. NPDC024017 TaxID=3154326 RepID=UPI0033C21961
MGDPEISEEREASPARSYDIFSFRSFLGASAKLLREHIRPARPGEDLVLLGDALQVAQCVGDVVGEVVQRTGETSA